jgi:transaldolase
VTYLDDLYATYGQSPWFDNIRRDWLDDGTLANLVKQGVRGVTSNPAIFAKAFATSSAYDPFVAASTESDPERLFENLAVIDVRDACDVLRPVYDASVAERSATGRRYLDGFVSLEVSPRLAHDTAGTVAAAKRLWAEVDRPNLMIKIPATLEGLPAIREVLGAGINVNVTLIFSVERYDAVISAWADGIALAAAQGLDVASIASVASFFVSRVDAAVDALLPDESPLRGRVANAQVAAAYARYRARIQSDEVTALLGRGAQVQRPLWASTSTKNPSYYDLLYVDFIAADETVNTMPDNTLEGVLDHGNFAQTLLDTDAKIHETAALLDELPSEISLSAVTEKLEIDGVASFISSYEELLNTVQSKMEK